MMIILVIILQSEKGSTNMDDCGKDLKRKHVAADLGNISFKSDLKFFKT